MSIKVHSLYTPAAQLTYAMPKQCPLTSCAHTYQLAHAYQLLERKKQQKHRSAISASSTAADGAVRLNTHACPALPCSMQPQPMLSCDDTSNKTCKKCTEAQRHPPILPSQHATQETRTVSDPRPGHIPLHNLSAGMTEAHEPVIQLSLIKSCTSIARSI